MCLQAPSQLGHPAMHKYRLERRKHSRSMTSLVSWEAVSDEVDPLDVSASDLQLQVMRMLLFPRLKAMLCSPGS